MNSIYYGEILEGGGHWAQQLGWFVGSWVVWAGLVSGWAGLGWFVGSWARGSRGLRCGGFVGRSRVRVGELPESD